MAKKRDSEKARGRDGVKISAEELDAEVQQYRAALKADTLCDRCLFANPPKSRYCADCGRALG